MSKFSLKHGGCWKGAHLYTQIWLTGKDDIPYIMENKTSLKPPTSQYINNPIIPYGIYLFYWNIGYPLYNKPTYPFIIPMGYMDILDMWDIFPIFNNPLIIQ